jgi:predicted dehydrogenase
MAARLRVGVIGLGRRWRRYRRALEGPGPRLAVAALCDEVALRAEQEARELGCAAAAGPTELVERPDVEGVLLLDGQWYGLWPLGLACRTGKPVLCAASLAREEHADDLRRQVRDKGLPVLMPLAPEGELLLGRLRQLLEGPLGPARLVRASWTGRSARPGPLDRPAALALLHAVAGLLGGAPVGVATRGVPGAPGYASAVYEFGSGRVAELSLWGGPGGRPGCRLEVVAERGSVFADWPRRLRWQDGEGGHAWEGPSGAPERALLERFARGVREGQAMGPGFEDAYRALTWLRAARRSLAEGARVGIGEEAS